MRLLQTSIFTICLVFCNSIVCAAENFPVTTFGTPSCGSWFDNSKRVQNNFWLLGFMSGTESEYRIWEQHLTKIPGPEPLGAVKDAAQIFLWVDNYCKEYPLDDLLEAGRRLFIELQKKIEKK